MATTNRTIRLWKKMGRLSAAWMLLAGAAGQSLAADGPEMSHDGPVVVSGMPHMGEAVPASGTAYSLSSHAEQVAQAPFDAGYCPETPLFNDPLVDWFPRRPDLLVNAPNMLGDFIGVAYIGPPPPVDDNAIRFPEQNAVLRGITRYKAADNRSPRPQNRLWASYNYFDSAFNSNVDINRLTFGAELVLIRDLSLEVLLPINDFENAIPGDDSERYGDMRVILKGVVWETGRVLVSVGGALGIPTAERPGGVPGGLVAFSPFMGYIVQAPGSRFFLQGFFQMDIPFEDDDQGLWHTDVGLGAWVYRNPEAGAFTGLAPTIEFHAYNPIFDTPADGISGLIYDDVYNVTLGGTGYFLGDRLTVASGVAFPVSDKSDYDIEFMFHVNWRF